LSTNKTLNNQQNTNKTIINKINVLVLVFDQTVFGQVSCEPCKLLGVCVLTR